MAYPAGYVLSIKTQVSRQFLIKQIEIIQLLVFNKVIYLLICSLLKMKQKLVRHLYSTQLKK